MKHKYLILKNDDKKKLIIKEFAELNKYNEYYLFCEETYSSKAVESAISKGKDDLISILRTTNLYPPGVYVEKIAESVINLYGPESDQSVTLFFNDIDLIKKGWGKYEDVDDIEDEPDEVDELLTEEPNMLDELPGDDNAIKNISIPVQIQEDESSDIEEKN